MSDKYCDIDAIKKMAEDYQVADNPLFLATLHNYETVQLSIEKVHESLTESQATVTKEYVKGRENVYTNPLIKELPKLVSIANKTADELMDIISQYGRKFADDPQARWKALENLRKVKQHIRYHEDEEIDVILDKILCMDKPFE